jgi:hypothetical protein
MKNKMMVIVLFGLMTISVLSFADDQPVTAPKASAGELVHEKATFNHDQAIYNDKANRNIRAKKLVAKKTKLNEQDNKKVQDQQDVNKGQFIVKF